MTELLHGTIYFLELYKNKFEFVSDFLLSPQRGVAFKAQE